MTPFSAVFSTKQTMENKLFQSVHVASIQQGTKARMISFAQELTEKLGITGRKNALNHYTKIH
jgi:hypothetical protein